MYRSALKLGTNRNSFLDVHTEEMLYKMIEKRSQKQYMNMQLTAMVSLVFPLCKIYEKVQREPGRCLTIPEKLTFFLLGFCLLNRIPSRIEFESCPILPLIKY